MNPDTLKQVLDSLEKNGAAALDGIATNAVMQAWGHFFILALLVVIISALGWLTFWLWMKEKEANCMNEGMWGLGGVFSGIATAVFLITFVVGLFEVPSNIATIKNPRAAAIRILLQR